MIKFLVSLSAIAVILFLIVTIVAPFKNNQQSSLYPKPPSHAASLVKLGIQAGQPIDDNGNILITDAVATRMASSGAQWVRVNFRLGPYSSDTAQFYAKYDSIITLLKSKGLQVYGLMSNESWPGSQSDWTAQNFENSRGSGENPYIDQFCYAFSRMAKHWEGQISDWEVWNEPNAYSTNPSPGVFTGATFIYPSNFAAMLTQCHSQVHYYNHINVSVISGGLFGHNISGYNTTSAGANYLDNTYSVGINGTKKFAWAKSTYGSYPLDAVGQHLYVDQGTTLNTSGFGSYLDYINNIVIKWEGAAVSKKTWITELGWSTKYVSESVQGSDLQSAFNVISGKNYIANVTWFQLDDSPASSFYYGIYHGDGSKKAVWTVFNNFVTTGIPSPTVAQSNIGRTSTGVIIPQILNYYNIYGGAAGNGQPYNNGGGIYAHVWDFGYVQDFNGGSIGKNTIFDTGHRVQASFLATYFIGNNHSVLKFPTSDEYAYGAGTRQNFQGGYMTWDSVNNVKVYTNPPTLTPTLSPTPTKVPIPTSTPVPPTPTSTITPTPTPISIVGKTSAGILIGPILNYYNSNGGVSVNGLPFNNGGSAYAHYWDFGYVQDFKGGSIGQNAIFDTGHRIQTSFLTTYLSGNNHSLLKFPINDAYAYGAGTRQDFQGGYMTWDSVNNVKVFSP